MNITEVTFDIAQLRQYAQRVISGGGVMQVWLVGSANWSSAPNDIDILYVIDPRQIRLPPNPDHDEPALIEFLETRTNIEPDLYDSFFQVGNTFWHLSWGAGASLIRNDAYATHESDKQKLLLASV